MAEYYNFPATNQVPMDERTWRFLNPSFNTFGGSDRVRPLVAPEVIPAESGYIHPIQNTRTEDILYRAANIWNGNSPYHGYENPLQDFYESGAIRGSSTYEGKAYFSTSPEFAYRSYGPDVGKNVYFEIDPRFTQRVRDGKNPLYDSLREAYYGGSYKYLEVPSTEVTSTINFDGTSIRHVENQPNKIRFLDRINPANRAGLRITTTDPVAINFEDMRAPSRSNVYGLYTESPPLPEDAPNFQAVKTSDGRTVYRHIKQHGGSYVIPNELTTLNTTVDNPNPRVVYDRITPFRQRTLGQHARNIATEARIFASQPEVRAVGNASLKAGGAAGFLLDAPEIMYKENKQRMLKNAEKGTFKEATPLEVTQMMGKAVMGSIANAVTLGTAYAGTGEGRPTRGPARMSDSGDEALRRTMERANSWMPKDDFSDVPTIDDDIKSFLR